MPGGSDEPSPDKRLPAVKVGAACRERSSCRRVSDALGSQLRCEQELLPVRAGALLAGGCLRGRSPPNHLGVLCVGFLGSASAQEGEPQLLVPVGNECLMLPGGGC